MLVSDKFCTAFIKWVDPVLTFIPVLFTVIPLPPTNSSTTLPLDAPPIIPSSDVNTAVISPPVPDRVFGTQLPEAESYCKTWPSVADPDTSDNPDSVDDPPPNPLNGAQEAESAKVVTKSAAMNVAWYVAEELSTHTIWSSDIRSIGIFKSWV